MAKNRFRQQVLTAAQQRYGMLLAFPDFRSGGRGERWWWVGTLQPSAISDLYTVQILYDMPLRPKVSVLAPTLQLAEGRERLPHVFPEDHLCLHLGHEWRPDMFISSTVVPWTAEWLIHYESWLLTGDWQGGGHETNR